MECDLYLHKLIGKSEGGEPSPQDDPWERPSEWPQIDHLIGESDDKMVAVFKVQKATTSNDGSPCAIRVQCPNGTYSVDWGDGTSDTGVATNTDAVHLYDKENVNLTDTSYGYKCAVITVTATTVITFINIDRPYASPPANSSSGRGHGWLDIDVQCPSVTTCNVAYNVNLVQFRLRQSSMSSFYGFFQYCRSLIKVVELNTSIDPTGACGYMFAYCGALKELPKDLVINTTSSNLNYMFRDCFVLPKIPTIIAPSALSSQYTFTRCVSAKEIPMLNIAGLGNIGGMFNGCTNLKKVPLDPDVCVNINSLAYTFQDCWSLTEVPAFNLSKVTSGNSLQRAFFSCFALKSIPVFPDMPSPTPTSTPTDMIRDCFSLERCGITRWDGSANITLTGCYMLGEDALNEIFTNLVDLTGYTSRTINVTACRGRAACNPAIATAKNWTVTT